MSKQSMKETVVSSVSQSGGFTTGSIGNINITNNDPQSDQKSNSLWVRLGIVATIAIGIVAVLQFFNVNPNSAEKGMTADNKEKVVISQDTYNVTSNNQQGGITAGTIGSINLGKERRTLKDDHKQELLEMLPKRDPVIVSTVANDPEAYNHATEVLNFLKDQGYDASGINVWMLTDKPLVGQSVNKTPNGYEVTIGSND